MAVRRDFSCVAILAALLFALLPGAALAEPRWLGPETLDTQAVATHSVPDVVANANGDAAAIWTVSTPSAPTKVNLAVTLRQRPWIDQQLDAGAEVPSGSTARVAVLPGGGFIAAWVAFADDQLQVRWTRQVPGRVGGMDFSEPQSLAAASDLVDLVAGPDGSVTALWYQPTENEDYFTATLSPEGVWGESQALPTSNAETPVLAVVPNGIVVAAWASRDCVGYCLESSARPPGGDWGPVEPVANNSGRSLEDLAIAATPDGQVTVVWADGTLNLLRSPGAQAPTLQSPPGGVFSATRSAVGTWSAPDAVANLAPEGAGCPDSDVPPCLDLAASADGSLAAVWQQGPVNPAIVASVRPSGGDWDGPTTIGDPEIGDAHPRVVYTALGTALAVWTAGSGPGAVTRSARRVPGQGWSAPPGEDIEPPATGDTSLSFDSLAADGEGNAVAAWLESGPQQRIRTEFFDGVGPRFDAFELPKTGTVGQALTFTADASDTLTSPTYIDWSLGDGTELIATPDRGFPGSITTFFRHAYSAPGTYTVTVRARDSIFNSTTRSGTVTVTPPTVNCGTADADKDKIGDACDTSDGSKPPVPFKTVSATVVSGDVFIKFPGGAGTASASQAAPKGFTRLQGSNTIPVGSTLDTSRGRVRLRSAADTRNHTQTGEFFDGVFKIGQVRKPRGEARKRPIGLITDLTLAGGSFSRCRAEASASARSKRKVRRLWGDGKGTFRTKGRHAAATVRGTRWLVEDRCDGTLVRVRRGRVEVRVKRRGRTVQVSAGHSYIARPS
jgi:hypothetical protein